MFFIVRYRENISDDFKIELLANSTVRLKIRTAENFIDCWDQEGRTRRESEMRSLVNGLRDVIKAIEANNNIYKTLTAAETKELVASVNGVINKHAPLCDETKDISNEKRRDCALI